MLKLLIKQDLEAICIANIYTNIIEPRLSEIIEWHSNGVSDRQIAENLGISYTTFKKYKKEKSDLSTALKKSGSDRIKVVENAMFKAAVGGNVTAQIFLLANWDPKKYKNNPQQYEIAMQKLKVLQDKDKKGKRRL